MIRSTHSVHINRPVPEVFEYLRNHENRIYWQGNLVEHKPQKTDGGAKVTEVRNVLGRRIEIEGEFTEVEPNRLLTFAGQGPHVQRLEYRYNLQADNGGTRVDTSMEVELPNKLDLAGPVIQRLTDRELDHAMKTLKDLLEQDEVRNMAKELPAHRHQHETPGAAR